MRVNDILNLMSDVEDMPFRRHLARAARRYLKVEIDKLVPPVNRVNARFRRPWDSQLNDAEWILALEGQKIKAIKAIRERLNLSLLDSKRMVENSGPSTWLIEEYQGYVARRNAAAKPLSDW